MLSLLLSFASAAAPASFDANQVKAAIAGASTWHVRKQVPTINAIATPADVRGFLDTLLPSTRTAVINAIHGTVAYTGHQADQAAFDAILAGPALPQPAQQPFGAVWLAKPAAEKDGLVKASQPYVDAMARLHNLEHVLDQVMGDYKAADAAEAMITAKRLRAEAAMKRYIENLEAGEEDNAPHANDTFADLSVPANAAKGKFVESNVA